MESTAPTRGIDNKSSRSCVKCVREARSKRFLFGVYATTTESPVPYRSLISRENSSTGSFSNSKESADASNRKFCACHKKKTTKKNKIKMTNLGLPNTRDSYFWVTSLDILLFFTTKTQLFEQSIPNQRSR